MEWYTEQEVQNLHETYWLYHKEEGYLFAGAMDIYVPMLALQTIFTYVGSSPLTITEKFFCRLVEEGICEISDIAFVLGLDEKIIQKIAMELEQSGLITIESEEDSKTKRCHFTKQGTSLYKSDKKVTIQKQEKIVFFNTVSQTIEEGIYENYEHNMPNDYLKLEPFFIPQNGEAKTKELFLSQLEQMFPNKSRVEELMIGKKEAYYKRYHMMLYCMEDRPSICFELYDRTKHCFDISAKMALQQRFSKGQLPRMMEIFQKAQEGNYYLTEFERQFCMKPVKIQYLMNREIRELVKNIFQLAQKSVCIVSPWISNDEEYVMSEGFLLQMEDALKKKGIRFTLAYGYKHQAYINELTDNYLARKLNFKDKVYQEKWNTCI